MLDSINPQLLIIIGGLLAILGGALAYRNEINYRKNADLVRETIDSLANENNQLNKQIKIKAKKIDETTIKNQILSEKNKVLNERIDIKSKQNQELIKTNIDITNNNSELSKHLIQETEKLQYPIPELYLKAHYAFKFPDVLEIKSKFEKYNKKNGGINIYRKHQDPYLNEICAFILSNIDDFRILLAIEAKEGKKPSKGSSKNSLNNVIGVISTNTLSLKNKDESPLMKLFYNFNSNCFSASTKIIPVELTKYVDYNSLLDFQGNKVIVRNISTNTTTSLANDLGAKFEFYTNEHSILPIATIIIENKENEDFYGHLILKRDEVNKTTDNN